MERELKKDLVIGSNGQLNLPASVMRRLRQDRKHKVRVVVSRSGDLTIRSVPDVTALYGSLASDTPYDPEERSKARAAMGMNANKRS